MSQAARLAGVSVASVAEARKRLREGRPVAEGTAPAYRAVPPTRRPPPPDDSTERALRATRASWEAAWNGEPATRGGLAAAALAAAIAEVVTCELPGRLVA